MCKCQTIATTYLELKPASTHEHLKFRYSSPFPDSRAFHLKSSGVLLSLALTVLRDRTQFEPKAVSCRCAHLGVCLGDEVSALPPQTWGIQAGREIGKHSSPVPPEVPEVHP